MTGEPVDSVAGGPADVAGGPRVGGLRSDVPAIGAAAGAALVASYVFQVLAGRSLGTDGFVAISSLWTLQYLTYAIFLLPLEQLIVRSAATASVGAVDRLRRSMTVTTLAVAAATGVMVGVFRDDLVGGDGRFAALAAGIVIGYGRFAFGRGRLSARQDHRGFALATGAEGILRLAVGVCLFWTGDPLAVALALLAAPTAILVWDRPSGEVAATGDPAPAGDRIGAQQSLYTVTNGCAQLLLGIAPILAAVLGASPRDVSVVFVVSTALRAPFWVLTAVSARILRWLVDRVAQPGGEAVLARWPLWLVGGIAVAGVGSALAAVVAPPVIALLFGPAFRPSIQLTVVLTAGAALIAAAMLQGLVLVATGQFREQAASWLAAVAVGVAFVAVLPLDPTMRAATGIAAAGGSALVGLTVVMVGAARQWRARPRSGRGRIS